MSKLHWLLSGLQTINIRKTSITKETSLPNMTGERILLHAQLEQVKYSS